MQRVLTQPHPLFEPACLQASFPLPLMQVTASEALAAALSTESSKLVSIDEATRKAVRDLLRHGGYKPTGRGKPSSEYLLGVAAEGTLPRINPAVDAGNAVSLRTGLPISVVDLDRVKGTCQLGLAAEGASYVFNASGQTIDLGGLLCLHDEEGPCANAVKDAQRTKTNGETCHVLVVIWGTRALPGQTQAAAASVQALLESCGATVTPVATA